jgi:hypothetical protein
MTTGRGHALVDHAATMSGLLLRDHARYFATSLDSPPFAAELAAIDHDPVLVTQEGVHLLRARTAVGDLDPAVKVAHWAGPALPTLVLHHGNNERPFAFGRTAKNLLGKAILLPEPPAANVLLVRAPYHAGSLRAYLRAVGELERFVAMLATSVAVMDHLTDRLQAVGCERVVLAGLSLGGWAVNLHRAHRNSADAYVPIFAGAALAEVFLSGAYRRLTSRRALANPAELRAVLNFEERFAAVTTRNVFPLLARYDGYVRFDRQRAGYGDHPVAVVDRGHVTGGLDAAALRAHVLAHLTAAADDPGRHTLAPGAPELTRAASRSPAGAPG